ncbi:MAG: hypothetical protein M0Z49_15905 [Chloroflexi bacterium]|nr:hypothetical protein [Chloroflexota bacterium]
MEARFPPLEREPSEQRDRSMYVLEITVSVVSLLAAFLLAAAR